LKTLGDRGLGCAFSSDQVGAKHGAGRIEWQNIDADGLPAEAKKSFDTMVEAEAAFNASCSPCAWFWI